VRSSTRIKHPRVVEGRGTEESAVNGSWRQHNSHKATADVGVNGYAGGKTGIIGEGARAKDIKRVTHGDITNMRGRSSPDTTVEKHSSTMAVMVKPEGVRGKV
jgi:hypothetical protein